MHGLDILSLYFLRSLCKSTIKTAARTKTKIATNYYSNQRSWQDILDHCDVAQLHRFKRTCSRFSRNLFHQLPSKSLEIFVSKLGCSFIALKNIFDLENMIYTESLCTTKVQLANRSQFSWSVQYICHLNKIVKKIVIIRVLLNNCCL